MKPKTNPTVPTKRRTSKRAPKSRFALIERKFPGRKTVGFPQMKGRTVEKVELFTSSDDHSIEIRFQDKTLLNFRFELGFTLRAGYLDSKTGDGRTIRRWPPIRSEG